MCREGLFFLGNATIGGSCLGLRLNGSNPRRRSKRPYVFGVPLYTGSSPTMIKNSCLEVYFDGSCPICSREVSFIKRHDAEQRVRFTDMTARDFDATTLHLDPQALTERIHARTPEGTVVTAVEVFRRIYGDLGYRRLVKFSRRPWIARILDTGYDWFAKHRKHLSRWYGVVEPRAARQRFLTK